MSALDFLESTNDTTTVPSSSSVVVIPAANEDNCNNISFAHFCSLLNKVEKTSGGSKKNDIIFSSDLKSRIGNGSIYPLLRLLIPSADTERGRYGLKQASIAKLYGHVLNLATTSADYQYMLNYNKGGTDQADFGTVLQRVLESRVRTEPSTCTIGDVNTLLDEIVVAWSKEKEDILRNKIVMKFSPNEQKWLMRIIFQDMKMGLNKESVLKHLDEDALDRFNACTSLRIVCNELCAGGSNQQLGLELFSIYSPMLAEKASKGAKGQIRFAEERMRGYPFVMDIKLDGERISCQTDGRRVMLATRNGSDYTEKYKKLAADIQLSFYGYKCIVDGEVLAYNLKSKDVVDFGSNRAVGKMENSHIGDISTADFVLMYTAFDLLYFDGKDAVTVINKHIRDYNRRFLPTVFAHVPYTDYQVPEVSSGGEIGKLPLYIRRAILRDVIILKDNRVDVVACKEVLSLNVSERLNELEQYYHTMYMLGEEGLVVKDITSSYHLGMKSRSLAHWVKLKPDYGEPEPLDVVVLGAFYGEGRGFRGQGLSTFLCGVKESDDSEMFVPFCKVGTGYDFAVLQAIRDNLKDCTATAPPSHVCAWPNPRNDVTPHVYLPKDKLFVVEMKCFELVPSTVYPSGMTTRFPRMKKLRPDKGITDITTMDELKLLLKSGMRSTAQLDKEKDKKRSPDKQAQATRAKRAATGAAVDQSFLITSHVAAEGSIFEGMLFCVKSFVDDFEYAPGVYDISAGRTKYDRQVLMDLIQKHGGQVVSNPIEGCFLITGSKISLEVKKYIEREEYDVLHFSYILDCIREKACTQPKLRHFKAFSKGRKASLMGTIDEYGDSYIDPVDLIDLQAMLLNLEGKCVPMTWREIYRHNEEDDELSALICELNPLFSRSVLVYIDMYTSLGTLLTTVYSESDSRVADVDASSLLVFERALLCFYGTNVTSVLTASVTHILIHPEQLQRRELIKERIRELRMMVLNSPEKYIVTPTWIRECLHANRIAKCDENGSVHDGNGWKLIWGDEDDDK